MQIIYTQMQTNSSRIWTQFPITHDNNNYTTSASQWSRIGKGNFGIEAFSIAWLYSKLRS